MHSRCIYIPVLTAVLLTGCAKEPIPERPVASSRDLMVKYGEGDSIRIGGAGNHFRCDDPAYAHVEKASTWSMDFADGTTINLCTSADEAKRMEWLAR
ncbi:MAG: hypothetical protein Kow0096_24050 [Thiohalomonadaceae bacterium]